MGLFSKKRKVPADHMAMQAMIVAIDSIGKFEKFQDVSDAKTMAVSMGYFYGFLKLNLNSITKLDITNAIVEQSLAYLEDAIKNEVSLRNISCAVRIFAGKALKSMEEEAKKRPENPFFGVAVTYLQDLYNNPPSIDLSKALTIAESMKYLYGEASSLTKNVKII